MAFITPVHVGAVVSCYCDVLEIGRSSVRIMVEVWINSRHDGEPIKVGHLNYYTGPFADVGDWFAATTEFTVAHANDTGDPIDAETALGTGLVSRVQGNHVGLRVALEVLADVADDQLLQIGVEGLALEAHHQALPGQLLRG